MRVYTSDKATLFLFILLLQIAPYFFINSGYWQLLIFNLISVYFILNSLKIYDFREDEIELSYRWVNKKIGVFTYEDITRVHYHVAIGPSSFDRIEIYTRKKLGFVTPIISVKSRKDAIEIIEFLKTKNVKTTNN